MSQPSGDSTFAGSVPAIYETHLVPLLFEPYAVDLARRVAAVAPSRVLEIAAGTGVVTRALAAALPAEVVVTATDLNQGMIDRAVGVGTVRPVIWRQADAMQLPFEDRAFDAAVCQFGVMFFPDRAAAFRETHRVLTPGGTWFFNAWDGITENEFGAAVTRALATMFPDDPPLFLVRTPYGYHEPEVIRRDLAAGGFTNPPRIDLVTHRSRAASAGDVATAYCLGTPLRGEIETRNASRLDEAVEVVTRAIAREFGTGPVEGRIQAHVITVER